MPSLTDTPTERTADDCTDDDATVTFVDYDQTADADTLARMPDASQPANDRHPDASDLTARELARAVVAMVRNRL